MIRYLCILMAAIAMINARAITPGEVRWHDKSRDTVEIERLIAIGVPLKTPGARVSAIGRALIGRPYVGATLEGSPEMLTVNLDELDCTTFVESVATLARVAANQGGWPDYLMALEEIRYRGGRLDGYGSRLHYISEWAVNNGMRGVIKEVTNLAPRVNYIVRTIDFMTSHRSAYTALKDSVEFERIKGVEAGLRGHRFPYIKTGDLGLKEVKGWLRDGDIVAFVCGLNDLDVTHMGIIVDDGGELKVLHASSKMKEVTLEQLPVANFVKRGGYKGIRVFRLPE